VRTVIVDDEPLARRGVRLRLQKFKDVEIVGECGDGASAVGKILELSPDVVFLDVQMPGMDGFEVLRALPRENLPSVIFLTAYEQHALRAFEVHALDYLLKPVDDERFTRRCAKSKAGGRIWFEDSDGRTNSANARARFRKVSIAFPGSNGFKDSGCAYRRHRVDCGSGRLRGIARWRTLSLIARDHELSGRETRSCAVSSRSSLPNFAGQMYP
jgi:DNA-binding LytR/AlgR family response regulator